uniref:Alkaline ceramidase n=1 Tax=Plectus sambesii TaxID=2011161 RepID=A0A914WYN2_9BILA
MIPITGEWFEPGSGFSWCESAYKYQVVSFIAEFANTVTNLPIIVLPLVNIALMRKYIAEVNPMLVVPHLLMTTNGLASAYYHATLNIFGQLIDELSILWLILLCLTAYLPVLRLFPPKLAPHIRFIRLTIVLVTLIVSIFAFLKPSVNAFALMIISIPSVVVIFYEGMKAGSKDASTAAWFVFVLWALACAFWCADRALCDVWLRLGTPYLHAVFHLLSSVSAYTVFVIFSWLDVERRRPQHGFRAAIRFFPRQCGVFGFPYITLTSRAAQE